MVPILTPHRRGGAHDEARLRDQVDYVIKGGVSGILAFGSNGEFYMVEEDEMERGLKIMVDQAAGRVPVYFGIAPSAPRSAAVWPKWPWQRRRFLRQCATAHVPQAHL